jgi:hypothetical protein
MRSKGGQEATETPSKAGRIGKPKRPKKKPERHEIQSNWNIRNGQWINDRNKLNARCNLCQ